METTTFLTLVIIVLATIAGLTMIIRTRQKRSDKKEIPTPALQEETPIQKPKLQTPQPQAEMPKPHPERSESRPEVAKEAPKIFISYRRDDSSDIMGRIYDRLVQHFGTDHIFKDVDSIPLGVDFKQQLDLAVSQCNFFLTVIGTNWIYGSKAVEKNLLHDSADFVRIEVESALQRDIPVIPLFVQKATMPDKEDLPDILMPLIYRNGLSIRSDPDFHNDMDRLIRAIGAHPKTKGNVENLNE